MKVCRDKFFLILSILLMLSGVDAQVTYNGTPPTFMTFNAPYVKCQYGSQWCSCNTDNSMWTCSGNNPSNWTASTYSGTGNNATNGILAASAQNWSHRFITSHTDTDPCMCYQTGNNTYVQSKALPEGGWDLEPSTTYDPIDTVIQLGGPVEQGKKSQSIEYWFRPDTNESVLLVMLAFATEASNHPTYQNAKFYVEVMDSAYNLLDLGYYPDLNGVPQNQNPFYWPYSRFLYVPIVETNSTCHLPYCFATPVGYDYYGTNDENKAFEVSECPYAQFSSAVPVSHSGCNSQWLRYTQIAFDLSKAARQHKTVIFRVKAHSCVMNYHWAYGYFAAKMIRGYIDVNACGDNEVWLSVPNGFSENSYVWYAGADSASAVHTEIYDGHHNIFLNYADGATIQPYYRCEVKTQGGVPIVYECHVNKYHDLHSCFTYEQITADPSAHNYTVKFNDCSIYDEYTYNPATSSFELQNPPLQHIEWDFGDDTPIQSAIGPVHTYDTLGVYRAVMFAYDNSGRCVDSTVQYVNVTSEPHIGVEDYADALGILVYPNPTSGEMHVDARTNRILTYTLYDVYGREVLTNKVDDFQTTVPMDNLPIGNYLLKIITDNGPITKKIIRK